MVEVSNKPHINDYLYVRMNSMYTILCYIMFGKGISGALRFICGSVLHNASLGSYIYVFSLATAIMLYCIKYFNSNEAKKTILAIAIYMLLLLTMYALNVNTQLYYESNFSYILDTAVIGIAGATFVARVLDWEYLFKKMLPYLRAVTIILCIVYVAGGRTFFGYMEWGQRITPNTLLYFGYIKKNKVKKPIDYFLFIVSLVLSLLGGRQSFVIVIGIIIITELYYALRKRTVKHIVALSIFAFVVVAISLFYDSIIIWLAQVLPRIGIRSRSLTMLAQNQLFDAYNRTAVYEMDLEIIETLGPRVSGLFTDRYMLTLMGSRVKFAHSFIYEILIDFGTILGSVILLAFLIKSIKIFLKSSFDNKIVFFVLFGVCVGRYFVSGSIFLENTFWLYIGLLFNKGIQIPSKNKEDSL